MTSCRLSLLISVIGWARLIRVDGGTLGTSKEQAKPRVFPGWITKDDNDDEEEEEEEDFEEGTRSRTTSRILLR